jgi:hypothetical protein
VAATGLAIDLGWGCVHPPGFRDWSEALAGSIVFVSSTRTATTTAARIHARHPMNFRH